MMTLRTLFRDNSSASVGALKSWYKDLRQEQRYSADRARLKRAHNLEDVVLVPAYHHLVSRILRATDGHDPRDAAAHRALAAVAALAAHIDTKSQSSGIPLATAMSQRPQGSKQPRVSELRFRRLLESQDVDQRFQVLRRLLPILQVPVDLVDLARAICDWGPTERNRLAYAYYASSDKHQKEGEA